MESVWTKKLISLVVDNQIGMNYGYVCLAGDVCTKLCFLFFGSCCAPVDGVEYFLSGKGLFLCFYIFKNHACGHGLGASRMQRDNGPGMEALIVATELQGSGGDYSQ